MKQEEKAGKTATKTAEDITENMILKIALRKLNSEGNARKRISSL